MRTASSPSLISISAIPDSSRSSISFLTLRISMLRIPLKVFRVLVCVLRFAGRLQRQQPGDGAHRKLVAISAQPDDGADRDVRKIGLLTKGLAGVDVAQVDFDEWQPHRGDGVSQRNTGVREGAGIEDQEVRAFTS